MTLEIARAARASAAINQLSLMLPHGLAGAEALDDLDDPITGPRAVQPVPIPWKVALGRVPGVQVLRRVKHGGLNRKVRDLARSCGRAPGVSRAEHDHPAGIPADHRDDE